MLRIIALLATYNERRFIQASLEHNIAQGLEVYLIDNESTDDTVQIAEQYLGRGLVGIETFPRGGMIQWSALMKRKEQLASTLDADWFLHLDCDEFRFSPRHRTLAEGIAEVDAAGFNAVNFIEYTFIPTLEEPDHDHPSFQSTMRYYYPFLPSFPHQLKAWKRQPVTVDLQSSAGHIVHFSDLRMAKESFSMRHYQSLSIAHAIEKYGSRNYAPADMNRGWHGWRNRFDGERITLPSRAELRKYTSDEALDPSNPRTTHLAASWAHSASDRTSRATVLASEGRDLLQAGLARTVIEPQDSDAISWRSEALLVNNLSDWPSPDRGLRAADDESRPIPARERMVAPLCIAGMHRSGTSMVARLVRAMGVDLGRDEDLTPSKPENPDGFWENVRFVEVNDEILAATGGAWDTPSELSDASAIGPARAKAELAILAFEHGRPWGWKDPRNSVTLPFWRAIFPDLKLLVCIRNPLEVALSLSRRNLFSL